ncbi:TonB-dependent receptor domain-containing protein [Cysteiniphilum sp. 6C5]|uniref:TonB-dependent receptor domain-containing protein n=1 Tax=unclassified Cysteiniphilum TaxID=2610889 RepID=UPI003F85F076
MKTKLLSVLVLTGIAQLMYASEESANTQAVDLGEIQVVAVKKALPSMPEKQSRASQINVAPEAGSALPNVSTQKGRGANLTQSTAMQLNEMAGVQMLGGNRPTTQSISMGGFSDDRVFVGIDGINNNLASFGHNQSRQLLNSALYKEVSASQSGSNIAYGNGNLGGAINFETLDPSDLLGKDKTVGGQVGLGGATGDYSGDANAAVAFKTGDVSYLVDIVGGRSNNVRLGNGQTLPDSASNNLQYLLKTVWDISKAQTLKASFLSMQNIGLYPATVNKETSSTNPSSNFNFFQTQSMLDYRFNPDNPYVDVKAKLYYNENHLSSSPTNNGGGFALPQDVHVNTTGMQLSNVTTVYKQRLYYGAEYSYINGYDGYSSKTSSNFPTANQQLYSAFLQDSWDILPRLNVTIGGRFNGYQSTSGDMNNDDSFFTKQASISYKVIDPLKVYLGYTEGYRIPSLQDLYLGGNHPYSHHVFLRFIPNTNLKPEIGHNKTIGFIYDQNLPDKQKMRVAGNVFLNDVNDYILNSNVSNDGPPSYTAVNQNINISKAQLYGYNVSAQYQNHWFEVMTNFTYTRGKTKSAYRNEDGNTIPAGSALPIPRAKGMVAFAVPIRVIDSTVQTRFDYALAQNHVPNNTPKVPGYALLSLAYQWQPSFVKGFTMSAGVDNLFDQYYQDYDGSTLMPSMGRSIYLQLNYRF